MCVYINIFKPTYCAIVTKACVVYIVYRAQELEETSETLLNELCSTFLISFSRNLRDVQNPKHLNRVICLHISI